MKKLPAAEQQVIFRKAKVLGKSLYPTIGEFAVSFEGICHALRMGISNILEHAGLKDSTLPDILVGDLTIFPLQNIYRALLVQTYKLTEDELKIIDNLFTRVTKLAEERNRILHCRWCIDFKDLQDIRELLLTGYKPGYSKRGTKPSPFKFPISEIKKLIRIIRELDDLIYQLNLCIYAGRAIGSRFQLNSKGQAIATRSIMDFFEKPKKRKK